MVLDAYRAKRDFTATSEPKGRKKRGKGHSFVIQKHGATRLHYDLRLEMDGVLKSWAVTRGPSLSVGEKRLAVHVEDHPVDYGDFEGTIPKGEYGAGTVIVWDRGTWVAVGDAAKGYAKGHLEFELDGEKLGGRWHLVRMQGKPAEKRENWLLIKAEDGFARDDDAQDILEERPESVKTQRTLDQVAAGDTKAANASPRKARKRPADEEPERTDPASVEGANAAALVDFVPPMLASSATEAPQGDRWIHEIKFDGYRLQARIAAGRVKLLTRSGLDWTDKFGGKVTRDLATLPVQDALLDGELVVEQDSGASDFSALQADLSEGRSDRFIFYAFDLLHLNGHDLRRVPLIRRKELLETVLAEAGPHLRYSGHFDEGGAIVLRHACRLSLEGVVSKVRDSTYQSGRSKAWVKSKCVARQEFVVAGFVPSTTARDAIGSLVLGVYEGAALMHVGRVGTGFTAAVSKDLFQRLGDLRADESPFAHRLTAEQGHKVRYVRPNLVAEVEYRAWTADGHLRHAAFRGLREDKPATEVVREGAATRAKPPNTAKRTVPLTHPDRLYWPDEGITKVGLADYYAEIWRYIAPHVVGRPLALLRGPNGLSGQTFFQKHGWKGMNAHIGQITDPKDPDEPLICISDLDGLMGLVQASTLEIHPWGSTQDDLERPDRIVMDLDPGEGVPWEQTIAAAHEVRQRLKDAGLAAFLKTSGGKGLHIVAPLKPHADWAAVKVFTKAMAEAMAADRPERFVATVTKSKRKGKILVDYLRNQRGATAVAAFSPRARAGAPVSTPITWDELGPDIGPRFFTLETLPTRLAALLADPWEDFRKRAVVLKKPR
jgi:bifunctional non-homologous end joining protein LigD